VLQFGGGSPAAMSPAHAAHHHEWRGLIDEHMREFENINEAGMTKAEIEAEEARMGAHMAEIEALSERIWAEPAQTWGDVVLCARAFSWKYWAGVDLDGPDAQAQLEGGPSAEIEDDDLASLLGAIFSVAGIGHFAEARNG